MCFQALLCSKGVSLLIFLFGLGFFPSPLFGCQIWMEVDANSEYPEVVNMSSGFFGSCILFGDCGILVSQLPQW